MRKGHVLFAAANASASTLTQLRNRRRQSSYTSDDLLVDNDNDGQDELREDDDGAVTARGISEDEEDADLVASVASVVRHPVGNFDVESIDSDLQLEHGTASAQSLAQEQLALDSLR